MGTSLLGNTSIYSNLSLKHSIPKSVVILPVKMLRFKLVANQLNYLCGHHVDAPIITTRRGVGIVGVSSDSKASGPESGELVSESDDEDVLLDKLPLDSKLQKKLEQKMRMKSAKKVRLRRKKLIRKRRLRKRGRWPPLKSNS